VKVFTWERNTEVLCIPFGCGHLTTAARSEASGSGHAGFTPFPQAKAFLASDLKKVSLIAVLRSGLRRGPKNRSGPME